MAPRRRAGRQAGVAHVLELLAAEMKVAMALTGNTNIQAIDPIRVWWHSLAHQPEIAADRLPLAHGVHGDAELPGASRGHGSHSPQSERRNCRFAAQTDEDFLYQIIDVVGLANAFGKVSNERHAVAAVQVCKERLPAAGSGGIGVRALRRRQHGICYMAVTCWTEGHLDVSRPSKNELRISLSIVRSCASYYFTPGTHRYFCGQPAR